MEGDPLNLLHQGVIAGKMKKKSATAVIAPAIGRLKKIASEPCEMIKLWRSAVSAKSPRTSARTRGAIG